MYPLCIYTCSFTHSFTHDTTTSEVVAKGKDSKAQLIADRVAQWSSENRVKLNNDKCKELRISVAKNQPEFQHILINGQELKVVQLAKLLGVTITSNLSWNEHINEIVKKASKRLYFLKQLKRARVPCKDMVLFYISCIRSILTYAVPVFHYALPKYLQCDLERVQKRALSKICLGLNYEETLQVAGIPTIHVFNESTCSNRFTSIVGSSEH